MSINGLENSRLEKKSKIQLVDILMESLYISFKDS